MTIPPNNIEAEMATLGSILIGDAGTRAPFRLVREFLEPEDFYRPTHQDIFRTLIAMDEEDANCPWDLITLIDALRVRGKLEDIGGAEYVMAVVDSVPTAANVAHYAKIVKRCAVLRQQQDAIREAAALLQKPDVDPADVERCLRDRLDDITRNNAIEIAGMEQIVPVYWNLLEERTRPSSKKLFSSGIPTMDREFGRLGEAQLVVLKAFRGTGKTHMMVHLSMQCAKANRAAVIGSLEMSRFQMTDRLMAYVTGLNSKTFRHVPDDDWGVVGKGSGELYKLPLYIIDECNIAVGELHRRCNALRARGVDIGLVTIDFAELLGAPGKNQSKEQELTQNAGLLRNMANDLDCTVVVLSQVNKEGMERHSQGLGNLADMLLALTIEDGKWELKAEKNRFGEAFKVPVHIDKTTSHLHEVTHEYGAEETTAQPWAQ